MVIFCLIFMAVMFAIGVPLMRFEIVKKKRFPWIGLICVILIGAVFIISQSVFHNHVIGEAEHQANLHDIPINTCEEIYYDQFGDTYFVIKMHDWDITKMFYRYELDKEEAKVYIEHQRAVSENNLFD